MRVSLISLPSKEGVVVRDLFYGGGCSGRRIANAKFPPLNLLYVEAVLRQAGHDTRVFDFQCRPFRLRSAIALNRAFKPDVIICSSASSTFSSDVKVLSKLKGDALVVVFGPHVTFLPEESLSCSVIDFVVIGEPEYVIRGLLEAIKSGRHYNVPGIGFRQGAKAIVNTPPPPAPIESIPFPDRSCLKGNTYFNPLVIASSWTTILASRGCNRHCIFCASPAFWGVARCRSPESVLSEIQMLVKEGYSEFFFRDESLTANRKFILDFCSLLLAQGLAIRWICNARVDEVDLALLALMKRAGCHTIKFGVESGSQRILDNLDKGVTLRRVYSAFEDCRKAAIDTHAHFMFGCIGETAETIAETMRFAKLLQPTTATFGVFTPYPGTRAFSLFRGGSGDASWDFSRASCNTAFTSLSAMQIDRAVSDAYRQFYFRPSYFFRRLFRFGSSGGIFRSFCSMIDVLLFSLRST